MSSHRETTVERSSIDEVLNLSDNIFVHLLCWKLGFHNQKIFDCGIRYVQELKASQVDFTK